MKWQKYMSGFMALLIAVSVSLPYAHAFSHDQPSHCCDDGSTALHIHQQDIDCDLCHFHLSSFSSFAHFTYEINVPQQTVERSFDLLPPVYISSRPSFSLRGPPIAVFRAC